MPNCSYYGEVLIVIDVLLTYKIPGKWKRMPTDYIKYRKYRKECKIST